MDTGKTVEEINAESVDFDIYTHLLFTYRSISPVNKHTNTLGIAALLEHTYVYGNSTLFSYLPSFFRADEVMKASAYLPEILSDPVTKLSEAPQHSPFAVCLDLRTKRVGFQFMHTFFT